MKLGPVRLNAAIAVLFVIGSPCFILTYVVGSIFFTSASYLQLLQAQSPAMTDVDAAGQHEPRDVRFRRWLPQDRGWLAAISQFPGTLLFNASTLAALAHNATALQRQPRSAPGPHRTALTSPRPPPSPRSMS